MNAPVSTPVSNLSTRVGTPVRTPVNTTAHTPVNTLMSALVKTSPSPRTSSSLEEWSYRYFDLFSENNQGACETSITAFQELTPLSKKFFCKENLDKIQKTIQERIFIHHKYRIGRQNDTQLNIIKRSIYLQFSKNSL